jgi:prepilin-type N-terminal cleavage/methylation domain-containing protein
MSKNIISYHYNNNSSSFTLIELLIVIAILAILMSVVVIAINPAEILKRARDTQRINDLSNLHELLQLANSEGLLTSDICDGTKIYVSLPNSIPLSNTNLPSGVSW